MPNKSIEIPEFKFKIGDKITELNPNDKMDYMIYDISYSLLTGEWYYRYKYWEGGYEHYCKSSIECVETNFEAVK